MSVSLIPDSAPFSAEQRAWLNGFLTGWLGVDGEAASTSGVNGTLLGLPNSPQSEQSEAKPEEDFPWHDPSLPIVDRLELADGKPLERRLMAAMAQLDCGACGYLCQTYSEAIASGEEKCLTLCSPGGGETTKALKKILKDQGSANNGAANGRVNGEATVNGKVNGKVETAAPTAGRASSGGRQNPAPARIKTIRNLNGPGSAKHTAHVEIDLTGSGLEYRVGDALGIYPTNCDELVSSVIEALDAAGDEQVTSPAGAALTLSEALRRDCDLATVDEDLLELLAALAASEGEQATLNRVISDDALGKYDVLDVLLLAPSARPSAQQFVDRLARLQPRLYSIASSPKRHAGEVHLTVARVANEIRGRQRKGVASTMLADRIQPGDEVRVFVHAAHEFTVPSDAEAPMIMVGPGTGIAPFRAFLEERIADNASGPNWLFFGDQRCATDFLYRDELEPLVAAGRLRMDTAFSRDQEEKIYVQHRMHQAGADLFDWLEKGAYFFVCGDAKRMAVDVDRALHEIVAAHAGLSEEQAAEYVAQLRKAGRYVRDVY